MMPLAEPARRVAMRAWLLWLLRETAAPLGLTLAAARDLAMSILVDLDDSVLADLDDVDGDNGNPAGSS
jgi:hypothetical protein